MKAYLLFQRLTLVMASLGLLAPATFGQVTNPPTGTVVAWGANDSGQTNVPPGLTNVTAIAACGKHALALKGDGTVVAWGSTGTNVPANLHDVVGIGAGFGQNLAIKADGRVIEWSGSSQGEVPNLSNVVAVAGGNGFSVALKADGTVAVWGEPSRVCQKNVPPGLANVVAISAGEQHILALKEDSTAIGWGNITAWCRTYTPARMTNVVAIAADGGSTGHDLALKSDGTVVSGGASELYDTPPADWANVIAIASGWTHRLALRADGTVVTWGGPNVPPDLPRVQAIAVGDSFSLALVNPGQATAPPLIQGQPLSQTVPFGSNVTLSVRATGFPPLRYQWFYGTNLIAGATNWFLTLTNLQMSQSGSYSVVVGNTAGEVTSQPAWVNVEPVLDLSLVAAVRIIGEIGRSFRVEYINAFGEATNWQPAGTITLTNNPQVFVDLESANQPKRFYRAVLLPGP